MRVLTVVGARPQFVKASPVCRALDAAAVDTIIVHTGQHFDAEMSQVFFEEMSIPKPDINLDVHGGSHGQMTSRMIEAIEEVLLRVMPDWVLVFGDTNSTLAAALAVAKLPEIKLAHVEAGLRSFNRSMPEEVNRVVTDHMSHLCLTPTETADENLRREGIEGDSVVRSGDVMYDAVLQFGALAEERSTVLDTFGLDAGAYVLATVHRAENTDDPARLKSIAAALAALSAQAPVVLPLHPRTAQALQREGLELAGTVVLPPVGYLDMVALERHARLIVTDSGGVQKEAFFLGRPCVTLRGETEWTELVDLGWNRLLPPTDGPALIAGLEAALEAGAGRVASPYGDGDAARLVVDALLRA